MKRTAYLLAGALIAVAAPALAQSKFDGTWKVDPANVTTPSKPNTFTINGGNYSCSTCIPAFTVPADGQFHAVKDKPYWDDISVAVVDPMTVKYQYRKAGKVVSETTAAVSDGGNTLTYTTHNTNNGGGVPIDSVTSATRVGAAPAGAHAVSGSWKTNKPTSVSDAAMTMTLKVTGTTLNMTSPMGETLTAKFGGPAAPNVGDPGKTMTKARKLNANAFELTDMNDGKVTQVATYTVAPDGKTLNGKWRDPRDGNSGGFMATKQ